MKHHRAVVVVRTGKFSDKVGSNLAAVSGLYFGSCTEHESHFENSFNMDLKFKVLIKGTSDREVYQQRQNKKRFMKSRSSEPAQARAKYDPSVIRSLNIIVVSWQSYSFIAV